MVEIVVEMLADLSTKFYTKMFAKCLHQIYGGIFHSLVELLAEVRVKLHPTLPSVILQHTLLVCPAHALIQSLSIRHVMLKIWKLSI